MLRSVLPSSKLTSRLVAMLDGLSTSVMLVDTAGSIVYANPSLIAVLEDARSSTEKKLPDFFVEALIGSKAIDLLGKASGVMGLIERSSEPVVERLTIGLMTFDLKAKSVLDERGSRLGTSIEWRDAYNRLKSEDSTVQIAASCQVDMSIQKVHQVSAALG